MIQLALDVVIFDGLLWVLLGWGENEAAGNTPAAQLKVVI